MKLLAQRMRALGAADARAGKPIDSFYLIPRIQHTDKRCAEYEIGYRAERLRIAQKRAVIEALQVPDHALRLKLTPMGHLMFALGNGAARVTVQRYAYRILLHAADHIAPYEVDAAFRLIDLATQLMWETERRR